MVAVKSINPAGISVIQYVLRMEQGMGLDDLRAGMSEPQRSILNAIWRYQMEHDRAIPVITLCDTLGLDVKTLETELQQLGGDIAFTFGRNQSMRRYQLTFLGYLLAERGVELEDLLAKYLNYVRLQLKADPELEKINLPAAMEETGFSSDQKEFFSRMFFSTPFHGGGSRMETKLPPDVDDWYPHPDLRKYLHERSLRNYDPQTPIVGGRQTYIQIAVPGFRNSLDGTPVEASPHFPPQLIQYFHAPVGVVQSGHQANALVTQSSDSARHPAQSTTVTFIDWCSRILDLLINESEKDPYAWTDGIDENRLYRLLFNLEEIEDFHGSRHRHGTLDALREMAKLGWLDQKGHFWKVTLAGREAAQSIERVWEEICGVKIAADEERILLAVNTLGEGAARDHAWLERVHHTALLPEMGDSDLMKTLWPVSQDLAARGLIERDARIGPHLNLRPTYTGIVWQTKRRTLGQPEVGHVVFLDIVGYSKLSLDEQALAIEQLESVIKATESFRTAKPKRNLVSLTTGDGMALVFFGGVTPHLECAIEVSRELAVRTQLPVRIGINSGPVYRRVDINTNMNVAGGGINIAQRVMDCGDAGHILLSKGAADLLYQLGGWEERLHDLGEAEVKHGLKVHLYNFYDESVGNAMVPAKIVIARRNEG